MKSAGKVKRKLSADNSLHKVITKTVEYQEHFILVICNSRIAGIIDNIVPFVAKLLTFESGQELLNIIPNEIQF